MPVPALQRCCVPCILNRRSMRLSLVVSLAFLPLSASSLVAQTGLAGSELQPGARIRVVAPGVVAGRYEGTLLSRTPDTLRLGSPNGAPVAIPVARLTSLEVSRGKSRSAGAVRGIMWGAPIGLALGATSASSATGDCIGCTKDYSRGGWVALSTFGGALWGAGIGALIGRERWDGFQLAPRTAIGMQTGGASLGFSLEF
jgi:hypothetical protein